MGAINALMLVLFYNAFMCCNRSLVGDTVFSREDNFLLKSEYCDMKISNLLSVIGCQVGKIIPKSIIHPSKIRGERMEKSEYNYPS